jgi:hypothetical protein
MCNEHTPHEEDFPNLESDSIFTGSIQCLPLQPLFELDLKTWQRHKNKQDCQEEMDKKSKQTHFYICSYYSQQKIREHLNQHADSIEPPSQISNIRGEREL